MVLRLSYDTGTWLFYALVVILNHHSTLISPNPMQSVLIFKQKMLKEEIPRHLNSILLTI